MRATNEGTSTSGLGTWQVRRRPLPKKPADEGRRRDTVSDMTLRNTFRRFTSSGETVFALSAKARRDLARGSLSQMDTLREKTSEGGPPGVRAMQGIIQPLFALSGYRLVAETERKGAIRFDLVGENIIGGDDRVLVDFKHVVGDDQRVGSVGGSIIEYAKSLTPADPSRVVCIRTGSRHNRSLRIVEAYAGPRLEIWDWADVREAFEAMLLDQDDKDSALASIMADMLDRLAVGIAEAQIDLRQIEWRDLERMVGHVLKELGYAVNVTAASQDDGRDVIVADVNVQPLGIYNIEIKHWTEEPVGSREMRRLLDVSVREGRDGALMLATSGVRDNALRVRSETMLDYLRVGRDTKIVMACRSFVKRRAGLWTAPQPFKSFMLEGTV